MQLSDITQTLEDLAAEQDTVQVGTVVESFGSRGHGPFLIIPALIEMTPLGGIPGVPTALAVIVLLFSLQILIGRKHLWLPAFARNLSMGSDKVIKGLDKVEPVVQKLDSWFSGERLRVLTYPPYTNVAAAVCIILTLSVPALELLPFASTAPMLAIALFGLAMLIHDGLLMIIALSASLLSFTAVGLLVT